MWNAKASKPDYFDVELKHALVVLSQTSLELRDGRQSDVSSTDRVAAAPSVTALNVARKKSSRDPKTGRSIGL